MSEVPEQVRRKALDINRALKPTGIPYAFGGAIAYGFAATPRSTLAIDIDVFLPETEAERIIRLLRPLGLSDVPKEGLAHLARESQGRFDWDGTWVDLFFAFHEYHASAAARVRIEDFDGELIPVLAPEDITMFKIFFNRPNDWADSENVLAVQGRRFDLDYVLGWLERTIGPDDDRIERLKALASQVWERTDHID